MSSIPFRSPAAITRFLGTTAIGLTLDLWTKALAVRHLKDEPGVNVIPGWLRFDYTQNEGAVFGLGQGYRWLFILVSIAAIIFLSYLFYRSARQWFYQILLGMLLAGVLGNMIDRIWLGYVRDMIHALPRWPTLFPYIFNIADSFLCVGVALMLLYSFFTKPESAQAKAEANGEPKQG